MPQEKSKNLISVIKYRQKLKEEMGEGAYKAKMAEQKKLQREKQKIKKAEEIQNKKLVQIKSSALLKGSNIVADVFSSILNTIPEKIKSKRGRKIIYKPFDNMTEKEQRKLKQKEKKRDYQREYMRGVYAKKKLNKTLIKNT